LLTSGCSFVFVQEPNEAMIKREAPATCTSSRAMPVLDFAIGAVLGAAIFAATYGAIEEFNDECEGGQCYTPWKPALLASFLVVSPWWISSAVGLSDTQQCRRLRGP
jgi:hypothetical protein